MLKNTIHENKLLKENVQMLSRNIKEFTQQIYEKEKLLINSQNELAELKVNSESKYCIENSNEEIKNEYNIDLINNSNDVLSEDVLSGNQRMSMRLSKVSNNNIDVIPMSELTSFEANKFIDEIINKSTKEEKLNIRLELMHKLIIK